ncbi:MAG: leader peptide processing enzyme [Treponema sp.]|nr:leader peptide processing enzyme [Treponema sp.]
MNKKINTLLFVLGATLFNIIVALASFVLLLIFYVRVLHPVIQTGQDWAFALIFLFSIAISIIVYRIVLKILIEKVNVEKYFDPIFVRKGSKKKPPQNPS